MKSEILGNIYLLYRSHVIVLIMYVVLCCLCTAVAIGVVKFRLLDTRVKCIAVLLTVCIGDVILLGWRIKELIPVYADYKESSYVILEDATVTVSDKQSYHGFGLNSLNATHKVVAVDGEGNSYDLIIRQSHWDFDFCHDYTGTLVYLKHSGHVVWYDVDL
jgi:hypothetical protein